MLLESMHLMQLQEGDGSVELMARKKENLTLVTGVTVAGQLLLRMNKISDRLNEE